MALLCAFVVLARQTTAPIRLRRSCTGTASRLLSSKRQPGMNQAVVSANQLNKMILQEKERRNKRQRLNLANKPKTVKFIESEHMRHFNRLVMQNLSLLKSQSDLQSIVATTGLVFTQVSVTPSWSQVFIFWKSSTSDQVDQIQDRLDILAPNLRHQLHQLNELGKVPKVVFTQDYQHIRKANFMNIMSTLNGQEDQVGIENPALPCSRHLMMHVKLKTDVLNFDREKAMDEVKVFFVFCFKKTFINLFF